MFFFSRAVCLSVRLYCSTACPTKDPTYSVVLRAKTSIADEPREREKSKAKMFVPIPAKWHRLFSWSFFSPTFDSVLPFASFRSIEYHGTTPSMLWMTRIRHTIEYAKARVTRYDTGFIALRQLEGEIEDARKLVRSFSSSSSNFQLATNREIKEALDRRIVCKVQMVKLKLHPHTRTRQPSRLGWHGRNN